MRKALLTAAVGLSLASGARGACCYFAAINKDVTQPGQRAFITWDDEAHLESFTVQPTFEGNAEDFGMVIPTPSRPKLQEMPKDFFRALAVFTILEPMDISKFKKMNIYKSMRAAGAASYAEDKAAPPPVRVLEHGVVGSLDYKVLEADKAEALYDWLKTNKYSYGGDSQTLDHYIQKKWNFTVMKIDPRQMKKAANGSYTGEVTPTRFTFAADKPIYPLRITQISVKDQTDALLYVQSRHKMDLGGGFSYETNFLNMWSNAMSFAVPEKLTSQEKQWMSTIEKRQMQYSEAGSTLEWAGKLSKDRLAFCTGERKFNREAPEEEIKKLAILSGHLKQDWYLTKIRKVFQRQEMTQDLSLVNAKIWGATDDIDYVQILPTSPP